MLRTRLYGLVTLLVIGLVLIAAWLLSALNAEPVKVDYLIGNIRLPLALIVVCAFAVGVAVTALIGIGSSLPLRLANARLRRRLSRRDQEINTLRRRLSRQQ